jgi:hypothetical protein
MWAQMQKLIDMIEAGVEAVPTISEVSSAFEAVLRADKIVREQLFEPNQ